MRSIKRIFIITLSLIFVIMAISVITVSAAENEESALHSLVSSNTNLSSKAETAVAVSYGLDVIAYQNQMTVAGLKGNVLNFSADRFACAMNLSEVDYIVVTRLPDAVCGALYIGGEGVSVGQKIAKSDLSLMTYEEASSGVGSRTSFEFTVNGSAYRMICNVFMIDAVNYSPTVSMASYASLNTETYKDIKVSGVLSAYDPEGDELTYEIVRYPSRGRVILDDKTLGTYTYIPENSFTGEDNFSYVVKDKYGNYSAAASVTLTVSSQSSTTVYRDLLDSDIYSHAIAMTENGLMNGVQVGNYYYFEADRQVSRAEFVMTAMNAIGIKNVPDVASTGFYDDEDISEEMKGYIALAYSKGYISGIKSEGNIYFRPDESIKLSEASVIISNMIGYAEPQVSPVFLDSDSIPAWSNQAIESLYTLGILEVPEKTVGAGAYITRGNMAKLLNKTIQVINN